MFHDWNLFALLELGNVGNDLELKLDPHPNWNWNWFQKMVAGKLRRNLKFSKGLLRGLAEARWRVVGTPPAVVSALERSQFEL